jgi:4'-phosphopantetheinyl transferase
MWDRAPDGLSLPEAELHVWRVDLDSLPAEPFLADLAPEEAARRFRRPGDRDRFVAAHGALRRILSRYCGIAPAAVRFRRSARGKPYLEPESGIRFNLSDSGGLALVAVARCCEVGVDVERIRQISDALQIARRVLPPGEADALEALPPEERAERFFRYWTRFEARLKAAGRGLGDKPAEAGDWPVTDLEAGAGYMAAVAAARAPERISTWEYAD